MGTDVVAEGRAMELGKLIEQIIQEARTEGKFDNLAGKGRPLRLDENPYEDPAWRLANQMLKNAGYKPEWLMLGQELREAYEQARGVVARSKAWRDKILARLKGRADMDAVQERAWVATEWDRALRGFEEALEKINEGIFEFNLKVPSGKLQRQKFDVAQELERWRDG